MAANNEKVTRMVFLEELNQIGLRAKMDGEQGDWISRAEAAVVLAGALPPMNTGIAGGLPAPFADLNTMTLVQQQAVSTLYALGIMVGDGQLFHGELKLTRSELGAITQRTQARLGALPGTEVTGYEVITDLSTLPQEVQETALSLQGKVGAVTQRSGEDKYLILTAGERYTGGYAIEVTNVAETAGRTEVTVSLTAPGPDEIPLQAITYPQTVVRFAKAVKPIAVVNGEALAL